MVQNLVAEIRESPVEQARRELYALMGKSTVLGRQGIHGTRPSR